VREETLVERVLTVGDRIAGLELAGGEVVEATHYVDASGAVGLIRGAMGVGSEQPVELRNIAIWDYWDNAEWAVRIGVGGTRIQVRSLPYGWLWFIPLGPTRTSLGLVCPSEHYKQMNKSIEELYADAIAAQPEIARLVANANQHGNVQATKDWSHLSDRLAGENWFLCGESAGFADPILSAGMSLAHQSGREVAYTILELERGELDDDWLREQYDVRNRQSIKQHIRFALYWYSANARFTDLKEHCRQIASEAGLEMNPETAWHWLAAGGFVNSATSIPSLGSFDMTATKGLIEFFHGKGAGSTFETCNTFRLNIGVAEKAMMPLYREGRVQQVSSYRDGARSLPLTGHFQAVVQTIRFVTDINKIMERWRHVVARRVPPGEQEQVLGSLLSTLESMVFDGWVEASFNESSPLLRPDQIPAAQFPEPGEG